MNRIKKIIFIASTIALFYNNALSYFYVGGSNTSNQNNTNNQQNNSILKAANCSPSTQVSTIDFNNVKTYLDNSGLLWENRATGLGSYFVPKNGNSSALFAGGLWFGGKDINNQTKFAGIRFKQDGEDFWSGPLSVIPNTGNIDSGYLDYGPAEITPARCLNYDKFYIITKAEVEKFRSWYLCNQDPSCDASTEYPGYSIPKSITDWPGNGDPSYQEDLILAPFFDKNNDQIYNPNDGDYPWYDLDKEIDCRNNRKVTLFGDYTIWWVFNDKGNIHTENGGDPLGIEVHAQAFAFATNDAVNDMTFYNYEIINRSTQTLYNTFFAQYADADLGCSRDDYVGCDVSRGLGFAYNSDNNDGGESNDGCSGATGYGENPPAIGIDFFEGPYQDNNGVADNYFTLGSQNFLSEALQGNGIGYGDSVVDNERFGMRKFVYYTNIPSASTGDPDNAEQSYRYITGYWKDGTPFKYGNDGYNTTGVQCDFNFPCDPLTGQNSDPFGWGTGGVTNLPAWSEVNIDGNGTKNPANDRRFLQSAGPFTLKPGALNNITVGVVYARSNLGNLASVKKLKSADDLAQALFDNCFELLEGPPAPKMTIQELDKELILFIDPISNGKNIENYTVVDPTISTSLIQAGRNNEYRFEGYKIYQLKDNSVSIADIDDNSKARLVAQVDIKNGIKRLINYSLDEDLQVLTPQLMVNGNDKGLRHSFRVQNDLFSKSSISTLINHKKYHYLVISYAYNSYMDFDPSDANTFEGQKEPYLSSLKSYDGGTIKTYSGIPHINSVEVNGTISNSSYGDQFEITRLEGSGNGGNMLDLTKESEDYVVKNGFAEKLTYKAGYSPVEVKVIDPLNVKNDTYKIKFTPGPQSNITNSTWELISKSTGDVYNSDMAINVENEQIIPELGISIRIKSYKDIDTSYHKVVLSGSSYDLNNFGTQYSELIGSDIIPLDGQTNSWLGGLSDADGFIEKNWIFDGNLSNSYPFSTSETEKVLNKEYDDYINFDGSFERIINGTFSPSYLLKSEIRNIGTNTNLFDNHPLTSSITNLYDIHLKNKLNEISSVIIVFTKDKSKWTRAIVFEAANNSVYTEGGKEKLETRGSYSIDKNGVFSQTSQSSENESDANYINGKSMGWFPGYVIDVETGERLNVCYAEASDLAGYNGRDMQFNPTSDENDLLNTKKIWGGKHFLYIFKNPTGVKFDNNKSNSLLMNSNSGLKTIFNNLIWAGIPMLKEGGTLLKEDLKLRIGISNNYKRYSYTGSLNSVSENSWYPLYEFSTNKKATIFNDKSTALSGLDLIRAVPNPYYGYSQYEETKLQNTMKITNLPVKCKVSIYNTAGNLVREFTKDDETTFLEWDLRNSSNVPIAGGVYIINIEAEGIGNKVIKWYGNLRPQDLDTF